MYHRRSIELWLYKEFFIIDPYRTQSDAEFFLHLLASATLVDFPQFRDIHHLIPQVLDMKLRAELDNHRLEIEDSDKWEIYFKYRQIVSRFLIGPNCRHVGSNPLGSLFFYDWSRRSQENYVNLAKYLISFLSEFL